MINNLMDAVVGGMAYYLVGWGFAYGGPGDGTGNEFIGWGNFAMAPANEQDYLAFFFHYVFATTIATIVSGAVAESIQFRAYIIYSIILTGIVYPIASHWIWSGEGFLNKLGVIDYAGGGAVHALSGVAALMGAVALGPRDGHFVDGEVSEDPAIRCRNDGARCVHLVVRLHSLQCWLRRYGEGRNGRPNLPHRGDHGSGRMFWCHHRNWCGVRRQEIRIFGVCHEWGACRHGLCLLLLRSCPRLAYRLHHLAARCPLLLRFGQTRG